MAKKYRVGVIGRTGKGNYGHGVDTAWLEIPETEIVAVADEHTGGLAAAAKRTKAKNTYADYRKMLEQEQLDIVAICPRWIDQHHEIILACAEHGCHMYMEKPFVPTLEQADEIIRITEMKHLKLAIAHTSRYSPYTKSVKQLIAKGEIGDLLEFRARGKEDSRRGGGEDLWVLGTHMLDLMRDFAGDVATCYSQVREKGRPVVAADVYPGNEGIGPLAADSISAIYTFKNNLTGTFASHRGMSGQPTRFGLMIFGSKGIIEMQSGYGKPAYILRDSSWSPGRTAKKWEPVPITDEDKKIIADHGSHGGNMAAIHDLISAIENDALPNCSVYAARAATEMIVGVFESHRQGSNVPFPLKNRKNPLTLLK